MCVGREREKAAIGEFITGVVSASHGFALIGRSTEVRGQRGAVDDLLPRARPWRKQRRRELLPLAAHNCEEARYGMGR
jgi:hypothetical protein